MVSRLKRDIMVATNRLDAMRSVPELRATQADGISC
jgi:hypothetical protein